MFDSKDIRGLLKKEFEFLITDYNFHENSDLDADDVYSEVRFEKNNWKISIITTSHGSKISLRLISPTNEFGFLSHYFRKLDAKFNENENKTITLIDSIHFYSEFLMKYGHDLLIADTEKLTRILGILRTEQEFWTKPLVKKLSDK